LLHSVEQFASAVRRGSVECKFGKAAGAPACPPRVLHNPSSIPAVIAFIVANHNDGVVYRSLAGAGLNDTGFVEAESVVAGRHGDGEGSLGSLLFGSRFRHINPAVNEGDLRLLLLQARSALLCKVWIVTISGKAVVPHVPPDLVWPASVAAVVVVGAFDDLRGL